MSKTRKTTLAESPDAAQELTDIKPNEVSAVDMPAIGEPFVVVKRAGASTELKPGADTGYDSKGSRVHKTKRGGQMSMLTTEDVARPVMKAIESRLKGARDSVAELQSVVKSLPAKEDGSNEVPSFLVEMAKSAAAEIRSLQPGYSVSKKVRAGAGSVMSIHALAKRTEDIDKAEAISYLTRDQYVSVTQNVTEYLTTYVSGIEHDDDGPQMIPANLDKTIDDSAGELEKLADEHPVSGDAPEPEIDPDEVSELSKLNEQIERLNKVLHPVGKAGAKISSDRLKRLRGVSSGVSDASSTLKELIDELEETDNGGEEMSDTTKTEGGAAETPAQPEETTATKTEAPVEPTSEPTSEEPATKTQPEATGGSSDSGVTAEQFKSLLEMLDTKFNDLETKFEKGIGEVRETAEAAREDVKKFSLARGDSRSGGSDETTKSSTKTKKSSFANIIGTDVIPEEGSGE